MSLEQALQENTAMMATLVAALQEAARSTGCEGSDEVKLPHALTKVEVVANNALPAGKKTVKSHDAAPATRPPVADELKPVTFTELRERFLVLVKANKPGALRVLATLGLPKLTPESIEPEQYAGILVNIDKELANG